MNEWHENNTFWTDTEPALFTQERLQQAGKDAEQILTLLNLQPGATILDLGCGIGRHAWEFAKRGYRVTGVDRTAEYLDRAKARASEQDTEVEWVQDDMREFRRDKSFDAVVNLLTSFGYFADAADDRKVLSNIFATLNTKGVLLMDIMSKEVLARIYRERDWHEEPDGTILLEERRLTNDWNQLDIRWLILKENQRKEHRFSLRLYSAAELSALLAGVGFAHVDVYGSLAGAPYDHEAQRLVLVARK